MPFEEKCPQSFVTPLPFSVPNDVGDEPQDLTWARPRVLPLSYIPQPTAPLQPELLVGLYVLPHNDSQPGSPSLSRAVRDWCCVLIFVSLLSGTIPVNTAQGLKDPKGGNQIHRQGPAFVAPAFPGTSGQRTEAWV